MTLYGRRTLATVLGLGLVALSAGGCGSSGGNDTQATAAAKKPAAVAAVSDGAVRIDLSEWAVKSAVPQVPAGKVHFIATNSGSTEHEMIVIRTDKRASDLGTGARISEKDSVGEIGEFGAGKVDSTTLTLKPGHYALICNIAGHYAQGMSTDLEVAKG